VHAHDMAVPMASNPMAHPVLGSLLRYWQQKRGARILPSRRDIDPLEMGADLLPHLVLTDLFDRGTRVRFRLVGTNVVKRLGFDPTGRYLEGEMKGGWWDLAAALHRLAYCERAPLYAESEFQWGTGRRLQARHLLLPLTQDGPDPAIALGGMVFAAAEAFPPTIRALGESAVHTETRREVLKPSAPARDDDAIGREVA
jgi:hypothetical protein